MQHLNTLPPMDAQVESGGYTRWIPVLSLLSFAMGLLGGMVSAGGFLPTMLPPERAPASLSAGQGQVTMLPDIHEEHASIKNHFLSQWQLRLGPQPVVQAILKIRWDIAAWVHDNSPCLTPDNVRAFDSGK